MQFNQAIPNYTIDITGYQLGTLESKITSSIVILVASVLHKAQMLRSSKGYFMGLQKALTLSLMIHSHR